MRGEHRERARKCFEFTYRSFGPVRRILRDRPSLLELLGCLFPKIIPCDRNIILTRRGEEQEFTSLLPLLRTTSCGRRFSYATILCRDSIYFKKSKMEKMMKRERA